MSDVLAAIIPQSVGIGLTFVPITLIATTNVADEDAGLASGLFNTAQQVGGARGLAVLSTLAADKTSNTVAGLGHPPSPPELASALLDGFHVAFRRRRDPRRWRGAAAGAGRAQARRGQHRHERRRCRAPEPRAPICKKSCTSRRSR